MNVMDEGIVFLLVVWGIYIIGKMTHRAYWNHRTCKSCGHRRDYHAGRVWDCTHGLTWANRTINTCQCEEFK